MKAPLRILVVCSALSPLCVHVASAEDDTVLPVAFPVSRYLAIWEDSPFEREVIKPVVQTISSTFAQSLVLEGLVNDDERGPVAYVRDTREEKSFVVTREKSPSEANPYAIVGAQLSRNPEESKVTITDGNETAEIGFAAATLTQAISAPAAAPDSPSQAPGRPGQPGDGKGRPALQPGSAAPEPARPAGGRGSPAATPNEESAKPASITPALDRLDSEPRRRRVPLPGN